MLKKFALGMTATLAGVVSALEIDWTDRAVRLQVSDSAGGNPAPPVNVAMLFVGDPLKHGHAQRLHVAGKGNDAADPLGRLNSRGLSPCDMRRRRRNAHNRRGRRVPRSLRHVCVRCTDRHTPP